MNHWWKQLRNDVINDYFIVCSSHSFLEYIVLLCLKWTRLFTVIKFELKWTPMRDEIVSTLRVDQKSVFTLLTKPNTLSQSALLAGMDNNWWHMVARLQYLSTLLVTSWTWHEAKKLHHHQHWPGYIRIHRKFPVL